MTKGRALGSNDHTWSGDAPNLRLQPAAGQCFCERLGTNSVKHGEVIFVMPVDRVLGEQVSRLARYVEKGRPG